jgi:hypothetical protein
MAVIVTALAGFGASSAYAGKASPKPACCKPAHCLSQGAQISKTLSCCRADRPSETPAATPGVLKAPEGMGPPVAIAAVLVPTPRIVRTDSFQKNLHSTSPPLFELKSSFLI